jgi:hypothetical protein
MLWGQSEVSNPISVSIHLWCGTALGGGVATMISWCKVLMTRQDIMYQEPPNMTWNILRCSFLLDSELEWP